MTEDNATHTDPPVHCRLLGFLLRIILLAGALMGAFPARAQDNTQVLTRVDWGFAGAIPAGRWSPVRIWLSGQAGAEAGIIEITFEQDSTQRARIVIPASTTPGKITPVDAVVCLPTSPGVVRVTFTAGRREERMDFSEHAVNPESPLGSLFAGTRGLVASVEARSLARAFTPANKLPRPVVMGGTMVDNPSALTGDTLTTARWIQLGIAELEPSALPAIAQAYDGLQALVIEPNRLAGVDTRTVDAVREWVESGGRLVVVVAEDGDSWRRWLPAGQPGDLASPRPAAVTPAPASLVALLGHKTSKIEVRDADTWDTKAARPVPWGQAGQTINVSLNAGPFEPRSSFPARVWSTTPHGKRRGWTVRWSTDDRSNGLLAEGPVGLGWVTIVGVDPERVPASVDPTATSVVWRDVLSVALSGYLGTRLGNAVTHDAPVAAALNQIASVPRTTDMVLKAILIGSTALIVLLGPVDWLLVRRMRDRRRAWLSAIGWIALASLAAAVIPPRLRSSPSCIDAASVIDILQDSNSLASSAQTWQTSLTGLWAGTTLRFEPRGPLDGSWWHGLDADTQDDWGLAMGRNRRGGTTLAPFLTAQTASQSTAGRQNVPVLFRQSPWTYRTMLGTLRPATPLRAEVSRNAAGFLVTFGPLPEGVTMASAVLRTGDESFPLNEFDSKREIAGTYWTARTAAKMVVPTSSASTAPTEPWYGPVSIPFTPTPEATAFMGENSALGSLPGTSDRRLAIDTLAEDSGWAVLELSILGPLATLSLQTPNDRPDLWQTSTRTHFRLLVPLAGKEER